MRIIMLAAVAALIGTASSVRAEGTPESDRSLRDALPLFESNRCADIKDTAGQLFCGDPDLRSAGARLNVAVAGAAEPDRRSPDGGRRKRRVDRRAAT